MGRSALTVFRGTPTFPVYRTRATSIGEGEASVSPDSHPTRGPLSGRVAGEPRGGSGFGQSFLGASSRDGPVNRCGSRSSDGPAPRLSADDLVYCDLRFLIRLVTDPDNAPSPGLRNAHQATAAAEPTCQRACGWRRESGSHSGPPVAPSLPTMATAPRSRTGPSVPHDLSPNRSSEAATTERATAVGSATAGQTANRAPSTTRPGRCVCRSHERPTPATTRSNQASVTSWAHSA
jgi:hypothetical protein